jgi:hypothetical protein
MQSAPPPSTHLQDVEQLPELLAHQRHVTPPALLKAQLSHAVSKVLPGGLQDTSQHRAEQHDEAQQLQHSTTKHSGTRQGGGTAMMDTVHQSPPAPASESRKPFGAYVLDLKPRNKIKDASLGYIFCVMHHLQQGDAEGRRRSQVMAGARPRQPMLYDSSKQDMTWHHQGSSACHGKLSHGVHVQ